MTETNCALGAAQPQPADEADSAVSEAHSLRRRIVRHSKTLRRIDRSAAELTAALADAVPELEEPTTPMLDAIIWQEPPLYEIVRDRRTLSLHWVALHGRLRLGVVISKRCADGTVRAAQSFIFRKRDAIYLGRLAMVALSSERTRRSQFILALADQHARGRG